MYIILFLSEAGKKEFVTVVTKPVAFFMTTCEQNDLTLTYKILVYSKADPPKSIQPRRELTLQTGAGLCQTFKAIYWVHKKDTNVSGPQWKLASTYE